MKGLSLVSGTGRHQPMFFNELFAFKCRYCPFFLSGCAGSSSQLGLSLVAVSGVYSLFAMHGLLIAVVSLVAEQGL